MAYVSVLNPALFTHDQELTATVETLTERLFPPSFDRRRIGRTFRKIAENTLVRGIRNQPQGTPSPSITDQCLIEYAEKCRVPMWVPEQFEYHRPALMGRIHHVRTWVDLDAVSEECSAPARFKGCIRKLKIMQGLINLGLPSLSGVNSHNAAELEKHALKFDLDFAGMPYYAEAKDLLRDLVTVRVDYTEHDPRVLGYCYKGEDLISLTQKFFRQSTSLLAHPIKPGVTKVADLAQVSRVTTFMHEVCHVETVLNAVDAVMYEDEILRSYAYQDPVEAEWQKRCPKTMLEPESRVEVSGKTYGWVKCLALRVIDEQNETLRAEANAETWANHANIRLLIYAYPELDFLSGPVVRCRKTLLHHFSAFNVLRHPNLTLIQDLPDYNAEKDLWLQKKGKRTPKTVKALLNQLIAMYNMHGPSMDVMLKEAGLRLGQEDLADALKEKLHC